MIRNNIMSIAGVGLVCACTSCRSPLPAPPPPKPDTAEARGFLEPSGFAAPLVPNDKTYSASNRTTATVRTYPLMAASQEFARYEQKTFEVVLTNQPLLVRLEADTWHQGGQQRPRVDINGQKAGEFEIAWPSLAQRNYTALLFDKTSPPGISYSINYQGWLKATCLIKGELFVPGTNAVQVSVAVDRIKMANLVLEELIRFDECDSTYDMRRNPRSVEPEPITPALTNILTAPDSASAPWGGSNVSHLVRCETNADFIAFHFDGILNQQTYDVVTDGQDVWIGSASGLIRHAIQENQWFLYDRSSGLQGDFANSLALWNGYLALEAWNRHERDYVTKEGRYLLNPQTGEWTEVPDHQPTFIPEGAIIGDFQWTPTHGENVPGTRDFTGGGVVRKNIRSGVKTLFTTQDGLANDYCSSLCSDGRRIWVAHWHEEKGLSVYDLRSKKWTAVLQSVNGIANIGGPLLLLDENTLYVGQQGGLIVFDTKTMNAKRYTLRKGMPGYIVSGLAAHRSEVWIAANSFGESAGLIVFNKREKRKMRSMAPLPKIEFKPSEPAPAARPEKFLEKADAAADQLRKDMADEIPNLGAHAWAGEYYKGSGLGNLHLWVAPKSGFLYEWHGCLGLFDRNYGAASLSADGRVLLSPTHPTATSGVKELATDYYLLHWGKRTYLIATNEVIHFCNAVNSGAEPRQGMHGAFFLRDGDDALPAEGLPDVPEPYRHYLLDTPFTTTIAAVGGNLDRPHPGVMQRIPVTIAAGRSDGAWKDMELYINSPEQTSFHILTLTEVGETQSQGSLLMGTKNPVLPQVGWTLSTRPSGQ